MCAHVGNGVVMTIMVDVARVWMMRVWNFRRPCPLWMMNLRYDRCMRMKDGPVSAKVICRLRRSFVWKSIFNGLPIIYFREKSRSRCSRSEGFSKFRSFIEGMPGQICSKMVWGRKHLAMFPSQNFSNTETCWFMHTNTVWTREDASVCGLGKFPDDSPGDVILA